MLAAGSLLYLATLLTPLGGGTLQRWLPPVLYLGAAALCLLRLRAPEARQLPWVLLGAGLTTFGLGSLSYVLSGSHGALAVPWYSHAGWLAFYVLAYASVVVRLHRRQGAMAASLALDGVLVALTLAAVLAAFLAPSVVGHHGIGLGDALAGLIYPVADLLLIGVAVCACALSAWRGTRSWVLVLAGALLLLVPDVAVDVAAALDQEGRFDELRAGYPLGLLLLAAAPWQPEVAARRVRPGSFLLFATPAVCFVAASALQVVQAVAGLAALADGLSHVALALCAARAVLAHRDLARLHEARRFERGFQDAEIGMVLIDRERRWMRVNAAMCRLLGRPEEELVGRTVDHLVHPDDPGEGVTVREDFAAGRGGRAATYEMVLRRPDGRRLELLVTTAVIEGDDAWFFGQAQDITERNRALRHSAALAELGRLAIETSDPTPLTAAAERLVRRALPACRCAVIGDVGRPVPDDGALRVPVRRRTGAHQVVVAEREPSEGPFDDLDARFLRGVGDVLAGALDRSDAEAETRRQALQDPLTGLANRHALAGELRRALQEGRGPGSTTALMLLDVDRFKVVNDTLGHGAGDELLRLVARRLQELTRAEDVVARLGGDEFVVVCSRLAGPEPAGTLAQRLVEAFDEPFQLGDRELFLTTSVGVALTDGGLEDVCPEALLRDADVAMYRAKDQGGRRYELFDAALRAGVVRRLSLEHALRRALERDELVVHYQPVVDLRDGAIDGFEALVRWEHPQEGLVPPGDFIPVAEDTGLIRPIGAWVLQTACRQLAAFQAETDRRLHMSVNLSARQLTPELPGIVREALEEAGLAPRQLVLEITESLLVEHEPQLELLGRLRALGVAIALDDFGTGYSSLASVTEYELDSVKLDRALIAGLGTSRRATGLVRAVVEMSEALGLSVVAEGLEEPVQAAAAAELGCRHGQGWLYSRALPASEAEALLASWAAQDEPARAA